jgi:exodeoxyribonuclease VII large subunit
MPGRLPPDVLSVEQLARRVRDRLDADFGKVQVRGELSNFRRYGSGHWYFTLKDEQAQLSAAMFARDNRFVRFRPSDGDEVLIQGRVDLYLKRGDLQIVANWMEPLGEGRLQRRFEQLKARLEAEGLFAAERKKPLPRVPRRVGIVTSEKAAALQDMLRILAERDPTLSVLIAPTRVQGDGAAVQIAAALELLDRHGDVEVILCGRGGGSLEDLWAFNEEPVARAIAACRTPVISGVGHETDFTIADFVADARAPTPTAAAEMAAPARAELEASLRGLRGRLDEALHRDLRRRRLRLDELGGRLPTPRRRLDAAQQRVDEARQRLERAMRAGLGRRAAQLGSARRALDVLGPLQSLRRGYAIVTTNDRGPVARDADRLRPGDSVRVRLNRGALECTVDTVIPVDDLDLRGRRRS